MLSKENNVKHSESNKDDLLLGVDYGEVNIGLAFGRSGLVSPLKVVSGVNSETAIFEINRYIHENKVTKIVMGLPLTVDGKETTQSKKVRAFTKLLKIRSKKPVEFVNEFRTTEDLKSEPIDLGITKIKHGVVDHLSAALILKEYYSKE